MKINRNIYMRLLILIFCLLVLFEVSDIVFPELFHSIKIISFLTITIYIGATFILFFLVKDFDQKANEFRKNQQKMKNIFDTLDVAIWSHDLKNNTLLITPGIDYTATSWKISMKIQTFGKR
jgi:hypothetical protein